MGGGTALFFSGGKDGFHCRRHVAGIDHLLTTYDLATGRVPIQGLRIEVIRAQAAAMALPLLEVPLPTGAGNRTWARTLTDAITAAGFRRLVFGDLHLADIRAFRDRALASTGCELLYPLWTTDTASLASDMLADGIEARLCSLIPGTLASDLLGSSWDASLLATLPPGIDPCGERGEFHTIVTGGRGMESLRFLAGDRLSSFGYEVLDYRPA